MASANHMLMVFMGVEMASVPSYVLAGALKGRRRSSEAALKYAVYGAGAAGVMLYGISLLAGVLGTAHLPTMAIRLSEVFAPAAAAEPHVGKYMVLALGGLMVMVGLAFKLSAVPFHFWCPDVFEGASAEVNAFLSVASKAAALALLVRVAIGLSVVHGPIAPPHAAPDIGGQAQAAAPADASPGEGVIRAQSVDLGAEENRSLAPVRSFISKLLSFVAVITCTFGNLAAYGQTNIKRLLAYSTIAHAGYMIMPVAAAVTLAESQPQMAADALAALLFYIVVYLFMNLGAFAVVAFLRNTLGSEEIADYAGLIQRMPLVVLCFAVLLVSLIGLPPLAGFNGKWMIFGSLVNAGLWTVLVIGGVNTAISLVYYLRIIKLMTIDPEPAQRTPVSFPFLPAVLVAALTVPVIVLGVSFNEVYKLAQGVTSHLLP